MTTTTAGRLAVATVRGVPNTPVIHFEATGPREPAHFRTSPTVGGMYTHPAAVVEDVRWMPDTIEGQREWGTYLPPESSPLPRDCEAGEWS